MTVQQKPKSLNSNLSTSSQVETNGIEKSSSKSIKRNSPMRRRREKLPVNNEGLMPGRQDVLDWDTEAKAEWEGDYEGFGNNQMLGADPKTRKTRRFHVGPNGCEITGVYVTPDEKTMFVGIQHPGEAPTVNDPADPKRYSSWPDGNEGGRPRSSCIVITKDDGGPVGS